MQLFPRGSDTVDLIVNWMKNNYSTHGPHCNLFSIFQPIYFFDEIIFNLMQDISDKWLNKYDSLMDSHYFRMHEIKFVKLIEVFSINTIKSVNVQMVVDQSHNESKSKSKSNKHAQISTKNFDEVFMSIWHENRPMSVSLNWSYGDEFGVFDPSMFELVRFLYQTIETKFVRSTKRAKLKSIKSNTFEIRHIDWRYQMIAV